MLILIVKRILAGLVLFILCGLVFAAIEAVGRWFTLMCDKHPRLRTIMDNLVLTICFLTMAYLVGWFYTLCI